MSIGRWWSSSIAATRLHVHGLTIVFIGSAPIGGIADAPLSVLTRLRTYHSIQTESNGNQQVDQLSPRSNIISLPPWAASPFVMYAIVNCAPAKSENELLPFYELALRPDILQIINFYQLNAARGKTVHFFLSADFVYLHLEPRTAFGRSPLSFDRKCK